MKVNINRDTSARKVVAFIAKNGELVLRRQGDNTNIAITQHGLAYVGCIPFNDYAKQQTDNNLIYEGDSITIQF